MDDDLVDRMCCSPDTGEKLLAFDAFNEESGSASTHRHSTNRRIIFGGQHNDMS